MPKNRFYKLAGVTFLLATLFFAFSITATPVRAANFEVNEPDDTLSDTVCDAVCTLRDAIFEANAAAGSDTIQFNLGGGGVLASLSFPFGVLPDISDTVIIDGTTQGGVCDPLNLLVELNGTGVAATALNITADDVEIRGLIINAFGGDGIAISGDNAIIECNMIGLAPDGLSTFANTGHGININGGANNVIGRPNNNGRNIIAGNGGFGVNIQGAAATNNRLENNYIGTSVGGTAALPNNGGVRITGASGNFVGGVAPDSGNVISGNNGDGISILAGANTNSVEGNTIGLDQNGTAQLANTQNGININASTGAIIGGLNSFARNIISGNQGNGILVTGAASTNTTIQGNTIGADTVGTVPIANSLNGISLDGAVNSTIGGANPAEGNIISGNIGFGVNLINGASGNDVQSNLIGIDSSGFVAMPNNVGIVVDNSPNNTIGGAGIGNTVAGNTGSGITLVNTGSTGNIVQGNFVGTTSIDDIVGNGTYGVRINNASGNIVGGLITAERNTIKNNIRDGVVIINASTGNRVLGNLIEQNGGLGIDLADNDVTVNDAGDGDLGANNLQNFPTITSAQGTNNFAIIGGTLDSAASTTFRLEFFSSAACDPLNFGEGGAFIAGQDVTTDAGGNATFLFPLPAVVPIQFITSTATNLTTNETSEFSQCVLLTDAPEYTSDPIPGATIAVSTFLGTPLDVVIAVDNRGGRSDLSIDAITISNLTDFTRTAPAVAALPILVASGSPSSNFMQIIVTCNATATSGGTPFVTTVLVNTNDPLEPTIPPAGFLYTISCEVNIPLQPGYASNPAVGSTIPVTTTVGNPLAANISVSEAGDADLNVTNIVLSNTTDFTLTSPTSFTILDLGGVRNIIVECNATTASAGTPFTTTVTVTHNAPGSPATYTVECTVFAPGYDSNPPPSTVINLVTTVGTNTSTTITVSETGDSALNVGPITLTGDPELTRTTPASFTIVDGGADETITIGCDATTPTFVTPYTTIVSVPHNGVNVASPVTYTVNCVVTQAGYSSVPASGSVIPLVTSVGTPATATIAVSETGNEDLDITSVVLSNTTDFTLTSPNNFTVADASGLSEDITVDCNATALGTPSTTVTVNHNAPGSPATYTINCTINAAPAPAYDSNPVPGATIPLVTSIGSPLTATIAVSNIGALDLDIASVVLGNIIDFTLTSPAAFTIATAGAPQNITVDCNATAASGGTPFSTTVTVTHNGTNIASPATYTIDCTVNATPSPGYDSTPASGSPAIPLTTTVGTAATATIAVSEIGDAPLNITSVVLGNTTDFTLTSPTNFTINNGGANENITVDCNATAVSGGTPFSTTVTVTHNGINVPSPATYTIDCTVNVAPAPGYDSNPVPGSTIPLTTSVGTPATATIAVTQNGTADLNITNVVLSNTTDFTLTSPTNFTIATGVLTPTNITVQCNATAASGGTPFSTTVTVTHNGTNVASPATYTVDCTVNAVVAPGYNSNPIPGSTIPLTTTVGTASTATIAVTQNGTADLNITNVVLGNTTDFTLTSPTNFTIATGVLTPTNITVQCNATAASGGTPFSTTVTVTHNAVGSPATYTIDCTVNAVAAPGYTSNPVPGSTIPLTTTVGTASTATIAVTQNGTADLNITNVVLSNTTNFTLTSPTNFTIATGVLTPTNITVQCNATVAGTPSTTVTVTHNAVGSPATYTVNCTVNAIAAPGYGSTPPVGSTIPLTTTVGTPATATIAVTQNGTADLNITNIVLSNTTDFTLTSPTNFTIATGDLTPTNITVNCNATAASGGTPFSTTVTVTHNAVGSPATYTITCTVGPVGPAYSSNPPPAPAAGSTFATPNTTVGNFVTVSIDVSNIGTQPLSITSIVLTNTGVFSLLTPTTFTINPGGGSQVITIRCFSNTAGNFQTTITVTHNGLNVPSPATYTLNCAVTTSTVTTPGYGSAPAPNSTINFGSALLGTTVVQFLTVSETGGAQLNVTAPSVLISGANTADFAIVSGGPPFSIPDNSPNRVITLRCIPLGLGQRTATLTFITNDPARGSVFYTLVCTGVTVLPTPTPLPTAVPPPLVIGGTPISAGPTPVTAIVIQVRGLAVRSGPYLGASLLRVARPNETYTVLAINLDESSQYAWYLLQVGNRQGWASGRYLEISGDRFSLPSQSTIFDQIDDAPDRGITVITRSFTDLRRRPSSRSEILEPLPPNTSMSLIGRTRQNGGNWWFHVRYNGRTGWIPAWAIVRGGSTNEVPIR